MKESQDIYSPGGIAQLIGGKVKAKGKKSKLTSPKIKNRTADNDITHTSNSTTGPSVGMNAITKTKSKSKTNTSASTTNSTVCSSNTTSNVSTTRTNSSTHNATKLVNKTKSKSKSKNRQSSNAEPSSDAIVNDKLEKAFESVAKPTSPNTLDDSESFVDTSTQVENKSEGNMIGEGDASIPDRKNVREKSKLARQRKKEKAEAGPRTIFVGNLPSSTERKDLLKFFADYGKIESVRFRNIMRKDMKLSLRASAIKSDIHPLCKNVNAYVVFQGEQAAQAALEKNGEKLLGNSLRVDIADSVTKKEPNRKCSVFVGNVPFDASEEELRVHFSNIGAIVNVRLIRDRETRLGKGFGYVEFKSQDDVVLALQMDGTRFGKNMLRVQRCIKGKQSTKSEANPKSWAGAVSVPGASTAKSKDKKKLKAKKGKTESNPPTKKKSKKFVKNKK